MNNFSQSQGQFCRIAKLDGLIAARKGEGHGRPESNQGIMRRRTKWYAAQIIPRIDPREICAAFHRAGAEIAEKGHFWMETNI
jgi:hypothetical protein